MKTKTNENDILMTLGLALFLVLEFMIAVTCGDFYGPLTYSIISVGYASVLVAALVSGKTEPTTDETYSGYPKTFSQRYEAKIASK